MIEKRETALGAGLKWFMIMVFGSFLLIFIIDAPGKLQIDPDLATNLYMSLIMLVIGFMIWRSWRVAQQIKARPISLDALAKENGYVRGGKEPGYTTLFRAVEQRDARFLNTMSGDGWRYGDFTYNIYRRTKYGDYKAVEVYYSVLELDLPRKLPHLFFDSPGSHGLQFMPHLDESQRTSLEGDFDQYFTTYFPMHYHIDARSIISPEVMATMIDSGVSDIEIIGDKLYIYSPLIPVDHVAKFIKEGQEICKKLSDHIVFYRDEKLEDELDRKGVSIFGQKLRKRPRFPWLLLVLSGGVLTWVGIASLPKGEYTLFVLLAAMYAYAIFNEAKKNWWNVRNTNMSLDRRYRARIASKKRKSKSTYKGSEVT